MRRTRPVLLGLAALTLSACHRRAADATAVTPDEQTQLNDAAASLDADGNAALANVADTDPDGNTAGNTEDPS